MRKLRHREAECHATVIGLQGRDRSRSRAVWLQILPPAPRPYAACTRGRGLSGDGGKLRGPAGPGEPWSCRASRVSVSRWPCAGGKPVASGSLCFCPPTLTCSQVPGEPCSCPPSLGHLLGPRPSWDPNPSHLEPIGSLSPVPGLRVVSNCPPGSLSRAVPHGVSFHSRCSRRGGGRGSPGRVGPDWGAGTTGGPWAPSLTSLLDTPAPPP